jgi:hypothetical protein
MELLGCVEQVSKLDRARLLLGPLLPKAQKSEITLQTPRTV